jgi:hypothetical protein
MQRKFMMGTSGYKCENPTASPISSSGGTRDMLMGRRVQAGSLVSLIIMNVAANSQCIE